MGRLMFDTPTFELYANNGPLETRTAIAMMIVPLIGVCLRLYSKKLVRQPYAWDDWLIILALPFSWANSLLDIFAVKNGNLGRHVELISSLGQLQYVFKTLYAETLIYSISLAFTKFSITLFYRRLLRVRLMQNMLAVLEWILGLRLIATIIISIVPCLPIEKFWTRAASGTCIDNFSVLMFQAVTNIATDVALFAIPVPIVWTLQIPKIQRLSIIVVFALGSIVLVVSSFRLVSVIQFHDDETDLTWAVFPFAVWTTIELNVAIFCACIPVMRPLVNVFSGQKVEPRAGGGDSIDDGRLGMQRTWWPGFKTASSTNDSNFRMLEGNSLEESLNAYGFHTGFSTTITAGTGDGNEMDDMPTKGIRVERQVVWTS